MPPKKNGNQKSSAKPSRTIDQKVIITDADISDLLSQSLSRDPPSTVKISSAKGKRKAARRSPSAESDIQIVEAPAPSPKKKRTLQTSVDSASTSKMSGTGVAFEPYTLLEKLDAISAKSDQELALGAAVSPVGSGRPSRNIVKTAKALAAEAEVEKPKPKKSLKVIKVEANAALIAWELSKAPVQKDDAKQATSARLRSPIDLISEDDDLPEVTAISTSPVKTRRRIAQVVISDDDSPPPPESSQNPFVDDEAVEAHYSDGMEADGGAKNTSYSADVEDMSLSDTAEDSDGGAASDNGGASDKGEASPDSNAELAGPVDNETDVPEDAVMQPSLWHESLKPIYQDLPFIETLVNIKPFGYNDARASAFTTMRVSVGDMVAAMRPKDVSCLVAGLRFVKASPYVNTARIDPKELCSEGNRLKWADARGPAICIMLGLVTDCCLISVGLGGHSNNRFNVHKITIAPAPQEMRRDISAWGKVLGFTTASGPMTEDGFEFLTFGEGKGFSGTSSTPSTPKKTTSRFAKPFQTPMPASQGAMSGQALLFSTQVPIYDGRADFGLPFEFTEKDFLNLKSWPRYKENKHDIPVDSVVAVGYTIGVYFSTTSNARNISSNVQFVVVLSVPTVEVG